ncbi:transglutaminaseTgpA domain-containing protein [Nocardioides sp. GCM10027113]|uniref:transglutaminase family protein n=1 Tax=unclassified Nocardioides TaxID=2615069 RepID=UPI00360F09F4
MSDLRGSLRPGLGGGPSLTLPLAAAGTTWLAFLSWRGFTEQPAQFLGPLMVLAATVAVTGAVARWLRVPGPFVVLVQLLVSGMLAGALLSGAPLPFGDGRLRLQITFEDAVAAAQQYAAPVPASAGEGVAPLLVAGGLVCLLLVDALACTLRRVPLAGLPLLTVYSVPVSMLGGGVGWTVFAVTAAGFLLMLYLQMDDQLTRWGRPLGGESQADPSGFGVRTGSTRASAAAIGGVTTGLAVLLPVLIPTLDLDLLDGGVGSGDGDLVIKNPMVDLRRDLNRGEDVPLLRVRTDDPDPSYMRISVLNRFNGNEWTSGDRQVPTHQQADGEMPQLLGVAGTVARREFSYDVSVSPQFQSTWLPTQQLVSRVEAPGDWRYDLTTMDFLSGSKEQTAAGIDYEMTAVELQLSAADMARAGSSGGQVESDYLELPDGIPPAVANLANQVTRNEQSRFEKAQALQQWFRTDGGFTYRLEAEEGNGTDDLIRFLSEGEGGRVGYCEQFAASMAVMARTLGIPSRVAVGFLVPDRVGPNTFEYSAWDMHAWPELFFPGSGWVRFEPTPPGRASSVPAYSTDQVPEADDPSGLGIPRASELLPDRSENESAAPEESGSESDDAAAAAFPWRPVLGGVAAVLVVGGLLLTPRTVRRARTRRRVGAGPEAAWAELRDTAVDLGIVWPRDRSPREVRDHLVVHLGAPLDGDTPERPAHGPAVAPPEVLVALDTVVLAVERGRYARPGSAASGPGLAAEVGTVVDSLRGGATRSARRRADCWPRSVLAGGAAGQETGGAPITVRHGAVVDHVG